MPKQERRAEINSFVKGLITEASALNFPPDAIASGENFDLHRDGTISRRLGMDYEANGGFVNSGLTLDNLDTAGINTYRWLSVGGDPTRDIAVIQINQHLFFFDLSASVLSTSMLGTIILSSFPANKKYSFASLEGQLVAVGGVDVVAIITFTSGSFNILYDRLLTRDVWGVEETADPNYETDASYRGALTQQHLYNLHNQSWGIPRKAADGGLISPADYYFGAGLGVYPSNSEQVWPGLQFQAVAPGQDPFERVYVNLYQEVLGAKPVTAKGYFIIDVLRRGQSRTEQFYNNKSKYPELLGDVVLKADLTQNGASCIADFAGRVFYGGFTGQVVDGDKRSPEFSNYIFFSQVVKQRKDFIKCYQDGDPTSRDNADLLDTDGGFIRISGAKDILSLHNLETNLIVIATNGIWSITGGSDYGFSATNYKVTKISSFGGLSPSSVVIEGGSAYLWSEDGIYTIGRNQFGDLGMTNISISTIQKFYEDIPNVSKINAVGSYDLLDKKVRWIYKTGEAFTQSSLTYELVLDTALGAFSVNRISNAADFRIEVFGLFRASSYVIGDAGVAVLSGVEQVFSGIDSVVINESTIISGIHSTRYLTLRNESNSINFIFSQYNNRQWRDWQVTDNVGVDAFAFINSGAQTGGDSAVKKQIPYIVFHMFRTETGVDINGNPLNQSSCRVRYQWNFSDSAVSKKWSTLFQVYRYVKAFIPSNSLSDFDNGFEIITTKSKVRGMGRSFTMHLETSPFKDCRIVGWSLTVNGNSIT